MTAPTRARPSAADMLDVVRDALAIVCEQPRAEVGPDSKLADLGADSLGRVEVAEIIEADVAHLLPGLHISDEDLSAFVAVSDVVDYLMARL